MGNEVGMKAGQGREVGTKHDTGKIRFSLLPWSAVKEIVQVLEFGAKKYSEGNWRYVENPQTRYYDAAMRHLLAWFEGEKNDEETGLNHLAHAGCDILFLLWFDLTKK